MATAKNYHELQVWKKSHNFCIVIYRITNSFPSSEQFGLTNQLRRAAVSVPSNIVEGFERGSNKEFKQFLIVARGSVGELQAQIEIARDLEYISVDNFAKLHENLIEIHKMINGLIKAIR